VQAELAVGRTDDPLEHEADRVADQATRMADPGLFEPAVTSRANVDSSSATVPGIVHHVLQSPGQPLPAEARAFFEPRLGHDFSSVRVHADNIAAASARAMGAQAYTVGRDLAFAEGRYAPDGSAGRRLLGHELIHTIQQGAVGGLGPGGRRARPPANGLLAQRQGEPSTKDVQSLSANEIAKQWAQNRKALVAAAAAPDNSLGGHQLFQIWFHFWIDQLNTAADRKAQVGKALWKADRASYANNMDLFQNGKRDALGPDYQDAADRYDGANFMLSGQMRLLNWLEDWVDTGHHRLTFKAVNDKGLEIAKAQANFEEWVAPILLAIIGSVMEAPASRSTDPMRQLPPGPEPVPPSRQLGPSPTPAPPSRQLPPGPTPIPPSRQLPPGPAPIPPSRQLPPGPEPIPPSRQLPPGPAPIPPSRQLPPGPEPAPPSRQLPPGPAPIPPSRQLPPGPEPAPPSRQLGPGPTPAPVVVQQNVRNPNVRVGSDAPWTGVGPEPQWSNAKSVKAYDHIESTHGPKLKASNFQGRAASGQPQQGQWYNAEDWVAAEKMTPPHPGDYIVEFGRAVGRVYNADGTVTENVTRAFVQRRPDGTLNSAYPIDNGFTLR
jgi:hypothetical protein